MHTYVLLKNGHIMILWSDNPEDETMDLYELSDLESPVRHPEYPFLKRVNYSDVTVTDTNLSVLNYHYYEQHYKNMPRNPYC